MDLFNTNTEFLNYIFSLQWRENDPYKIECWPQGKFALSDLINYLERLSDDVLLALYRDIMLKAMHIRFEELSRVYPQEIFGYLYEDELEQVKEILADKMQHAVSLAVPMEIDLNVGSTWYDAH